MVLMPWVAGGGGGGGGVTGGGVGGGACTPVLVPPQAVRNNETIAMKTTDLSLDKSDIQGSPEL